MNQPSTPAPFRAWTVVLAAMSINLILGVLYAWSMMGKALQTDPAWHWTKAQTALPFSVATAAFAAMMIFAGRWQDKIGPRFVAMFGGILLGAGLCASSLARTPGMMLVTFGIVGGLGIGLGYSATTPPCIKWFPPYRKGLITGLVVSGVGLAAVYISPLTQFLLKRTGSIPNTFLILGIGAIVLVAVLSQALANPPAGYVPVGAGVSAGAARRVAAGRNLDWQEMLRTSQFYLLWVMFVLAAAAGLMVIAHIATIAKELGGIDAWGYVPVATLAIFNTLGRVVAGFLSDRIGRSRTMVLAFGAQALNMFAFTHYTNPALLLFGSAFAGLCYGTIFTLMPAASADFYGVRNLGVNYGFLFTAFGVAGVLGPMIGGKLRDVTGSFSYSFTISAVLLLVGTALAFAVKSPMSEGETYHREKAGEEAKAASK